MREDLQIVRRENTRETQRDAMRVIPHDELRSMQRFDRRTCTREALRDHVQHEVRAGRWTFVRGCTCGRHAEFRANQPAVP